MNLTGMVRMVEGLDPELGDKPPDNSTTPLPRSVSADDHYLALSSLRSADTADSSVASLASSDGSSLPMTPARRRQAFSSGASSNLVDVGFLDTRFPSPIASSATLLAFSQLIDDQQRHLTLG